MKYSHCNGCGIYRRGSVLGWGIATPDIPCRHCLGTGMLKEPVKPVKEMS